jgi:hypothetical protein
MSGIYKQQFIVYFGKPVVFDVGSYKGVCPFGDGRLNKFAA